MLSPKRFTIHKVGDVLKQKASTTYFGGQPAGVNRAGTMEVATATNLKLAKSNASAVSYVGVFANSSAEDVNTYGGQATYFAGTSIFTLCTTTPNTNNSTTNVDGARGLSNEGYPYDSALTWKVTDQLFIDANGKWSNTYVESTDPTFGTVLAVGSNYLVVQIADRTGVKWA